MSEKSNIHLTSEDLIIKIEGADEQKYAHFGGIDLQLKAIKLLIEQLDFKFAEENDSGAPQKILNEILETVGETYKYHIGEDELSNKDAIKYLLED